MMDEVDHMTSCLLPMHNDKKREVNGAGASGKLLVH